MQNRGYTLLAALLPIIVTHSAHSQSAPVDTLGREQARMRWNKALVHDTAYHYITTPNAFLQKALAGRKPGTALDAAMGAGRNAIYLAQSGWETTGYDIADEALGYARAEAARLHLRLKVVQQGSEEFDFGTAKWDLITYLYAGCIEDVPGLAARMARGLKPGGIIVFEFFHRDAGIEMKRPDFGCPANAEKEELLKAGLRIVSYEEKPGLGDYGIKTYQMIYLIAEK